MAESTHRSVSKSAHRLSPDPRRHALEIASQALSPKGGGFARELLDERFSGAPLDARDRAFAADLAYGVIRRLATLDAVLAAYSSRPIEELDAVVKQILRLGLYQMLFQERVPAHAIVDESVRLARATGKERATGFVNAVLRSITRDLKMVDAPDEVRPQSSFEMRPGRACVFGKAVLPPPADNAAYLSALYSFPIALTRRWLARYGNTKTRELFQTANEPPPIFVRPNTQKASLEQLAERLEAEGIKATFSPSGRTLRLPPRTRPGVLQSFKEGLFQVQDDSSAAVAPFLGPKPGEQVLDLCAAPGGKACHIAELMENAGSLVAVDSSERRMERVVQNVQQLDLRIIATVIADGAEFARQNLSKFDRVLLDAPCSNTGVLRRRVEARWRFSESALARLAATQKPLLHAALQCVKPGGAVVYSTCSIEPEEDSKLVAAAVKSATGCRLDAEETILPSPDGGDGVYMARIIRE